MPVPSPHIPSKPWNSDGVILSQLHASQLDLPHRSVVKWGEVEPGLILSSSGEI